MKKKFEFLTAKNGNLFNRGSENIMYKQECIYNVIRVYVNHEHSSDIHLIVQDERHLLSFKIA